MKKIALALLIIALVGFSAVYIFIPAEINFGRVCIIKVNSNVAKRYLSDENFWHKWWPKQKKDSAAGKIIYSYKNSLFTISYRNLSGANIYIEHNSDTISTDLNVFPVKKDSVAVEWSGKLPPTNNPFRRISNYIAARAFKKNISEILDSAKLFLETSQNLYKVRIEQTMVKDTILVATSYASATYPTTANIYKLVKDLKDYISANRSAETNYPMLNVAEDNGVFNTMVAIPVDKELPQNENFFLKRMFPGKILVAEAKGGVYTTHKVLDEIQLYIDDHHLTSPAKPFESLVTNRMEQPDTSKWVTKIYYPIF